MDYYGDYGTLSSTASTTGGAFGALVGAMIGFFIIFFIIVLVFAIFQIIGTWKTLNKGGQPGWAALIPFYGDYCLCKMTGVSPWWVLVVGVGSVLSGALSSIPVIGSIFPVAFSALSIYYAVILCFSLAKAFDKSEGFAVGLLLLRPFFIFALGNGKNEYKGENPMKDPIMELVMKKDGNTTNNVNNTMNNNVNTTEMNSNVNTTSTDMNNTNVVNTPSTETTAQASFCTGCGAKIEENSSFCTNCGKQV